MPILTFGVQVLATVLLTVSAVFGGQPGLVSSMGLVMGHEKHQGFSLVPVTDMPVRVYTEDHAPPQVFEIIRPDMQPFSVGRLYSSCSCLQVSMDKKDFGKGERAIVTVRNVKPTVAGGAVYAIFVQLDRPFREALQKDVHFKSEPKAGPKPPLPPKSHGSPPPPPLAPPPSRPKIVTGPGPVKPPEERKPPKFEDIKPYPNR